MIAKRNWFAIYTPAPFIQPITIQGLIYSLIWPVILIIIVFLPINLNIKIIGVLIIGIILYIDTKDIFDKASKDNREERELRKIFPELDKLQHLSKQLTKQRMIYILIVFILLLAIIIIPIDSLLKVISGTIVICFVIIDSQPIHSAYMKEVEKARRKKENPNLNLQFLSVLPFPFSVQLFAYIINTMMQFRYNKKI